jgi:hypothetical protein
VAPLRGNPAYLSTLARDALADAQEAHQRGRLGFLVGAGLSTAIGLPGWSAFNNALVERAFERHAPDGVEGADGDPHAPVDGRLEHAATRRLSRAYLDQLQGQSLAAVDFVRRRTGADFHVVVRGALYDWPSLRAYAPTEVHYALCRLAVETQPPYPCLHTTNYDDLLERALAVVSGKRPVAIHASRRLVPDGPRVVHLHGYFPYEAPQSAKSRLARELVLSDLDYSRLSNDHAAWTNRELLALLDSRSVMIIGMSLTDPNVRRLFAYLSDAPRREEGPQHFVVLQHRHPDGDRPEAIEAARLVDEDEHDFWKARGVKILRIGSWDRLNYLLRRIRFSDAEWDARHRDVRVAWARNTYGGVRFDDPEVQALGTQALESARNGLVDELRLEGRVELNLFLPQVDGTYRRALSSVPGRAAEAPRPFVPQHDRAMIPEVENALVIGAPLHRVLSDKRPPAPAGQPPFQTWYRSLVSIPTFDDAAGGVPVAVIQLCSSEEKLLAELDVARVAQLRSYLGEAVQGVCELLGHLRRSAPTAQPSQAAPPVKRGPQRATP